MSFPPQIIGEFETLRTLATRKASISRIGNGELNLMNGSFCKSQPADADICRALRKIAKHGSTARVLVGIPPIYGKIPRNKAAVWSRYTGAAWGRFYPARTYHSSFITRPDFFPALDCPEFWALWRAIWHQRPVLYVKGCTTPEPRVPEMLDNALRVDPMPAPPRDAWAAHAALLADCRAWAAAHSDGVVVLCLGPTATVLAAELGRLGHQAVDAGHSPSYFRDRGKLQEGAKAA